MEHGIELTVINTDEIINLTISNDFLLTDYNVSSPEPKTYTVEIDGRDGQLDYTEMFGSVKFKNRTVTATINLAKFDKSSQKALHRELMLLAHGQKVEITHWQSPDLYFKGRCTVGEISNENSSFTLTVDAEPYGYLLPAKSYNKTVATGETKTIAIDNAGKPVIPLLSVTGEITLVYDENTYTLSEGEHTVIDFIIATGDSSITVTGAGTINVTFTERVL